MLIEEDLDKVDHRSAVLRRSVDPCHLVRRGTQGSCHRDRTPVRLGLRKRLGLMARNVATAAILLHPERTELVDEEKEISGSKIVEGLEQKVDLLSIERIGARKNSPHLFHDVPRIPHETTCRARRNRSAMFSRICHCEGVKA